ncbi:MAG: STAS domain-containing protein [Bacteroidetes bacterium]|nr:STAS domain-containing protein [Bacteroidota bacterium]
MLKAFDHRKTEEGDLFIMPRRLSSETYLGWYDQILEMTAKSEGKVILDLNDSTYVSSVFIRFCLVMGKRSGRQNLVIRNANAEVKQIFLLSGLDELIEKP